MDIQDKLIPEGQTILLTVLLKDIVNCLNRMYVVKASTVTKEVEKMLGVGGEKGRKKSV